MPLSSDRHIVDEQFSRKLRHFKAQPSGRVWNRLSGSLQLERHVNPAARRGLLFALLLLLGFGTYWLTSTLQPGNNDKAGKQLKVTKGALPEKSLSSKHTLAAATIQQDKNVADLGSGTVNLPLHSEAFSFTNDPDNLTDESYGMQTASFPALSNDSQVPFGWQAENEQMEPLHLQFAEISRPSAVFAKGINDNQQVYPAAAKNPDFYIADAKGFYAGFGQTFNTTFIADSKAYHDENLRFSPTFGIALMIQGGYNFNNKWGLEGAWIIHSQEGQRYKYLPTNNRTTSLEYIQKHISFNYMQFPLLFRHKLQGWSGITESPFFVNYSLGVQYGRLVSYSVDESKERVSNQQLFRKNEYALVAALDYDFISRKSSFVTVGIRTSIGSNLFVKDTPENLEFDDPHNFLLGVHAAINFSLKRNMQVAGQ